MICAFCNAIQITEQQEHIQRYVENHRDTSMQIAPQGMAACNNGQKGDPDPHQITLSPI